MMKDKVTSEKIELWLDGSLSEEETHAFEARMDADPELRHKVAIHRRARLEIEQAVYRDFRKKTAAWRNDLDNLPLPPDFEDRANLWLGWIKKIFLGISFLFITPVIFHPLSQSAHFDKKIAFESPLKTYGRKVGPIANNTSMPDTFTVTILDKNKQAYFRNLIKKLLPNGKIWMESGSNRDSISNGMPIDFIVHDTFKTFKIAFDIYTQPSAGTINIDSINFAQKLAINNSEGATDTSNQIIEYVYSPLDTLDARNISHSDSISKIIPPGFFAFADEVELKMRISIESDLRSKSGEKKGVFSDIVKLNASKPTFLEFRTAADAFLKGEFSEAKRLLEPIASTRNPYTSIALKMLADVFYREEKFREATIYMEASAKEAADPLTNWQLLHFYLRDYQNSGTFFWQLLNSIILQKDEYKAKAKSLRKKLQKAGVQIIISPQIIDNEVINHAKPVVMIMPYVKKGENLKEVLEKNVVQKIALNKVREAFDARGFSTIALSKLSSTRANEMFANSKVKDQVIESSGANIYVVVEVDSIPDRAFGNSVVVNLIAYDVLTASILAKNTSRSVKLPINDYDKLIENALYSKENSRSIPVIEEFLYTILYRYFEK